MFCSECKLDDLSFVLQCSSHSDIDFRHVWSFKDATFKDTTGYLSTERATVSLAKVPMLTTRISGIRRSMPYSRYNIGRNALHQHLWHED